MGKEIGIDFGTTNTVVSYVNKKGSLRQLKYDRKEIIPTIIYFKTEDEYYVGQKANDLLRANKNQAGVTNFKPIIGEKTKIEIVPEEGEPFTMRPRKLAQLFLNKIVGGMQEKLFKEFGPIDGCIDTAVITVPAKFNSTEKENIRKAAKDAGLRMAKLAAEPTAAAIAYQNDLGIEEGEDSKNAVLVYDFGGGTFDVSVICKDNGKFREIATDGDKELGGSNLTARIAENLLEAVNDEYGMELPFDPEEFDEDYHEMPHATYVKNMIEINSAANNIKETLSDAEHVIQDCTIIDTEGETQNYTFNYGRKEIEKIIKADIKHTVDITSNAITEAKNQGVNISQVVLAGGSSNIPLVKELLEKEVSLENVVYSEDVSTLISRGAAVLAGKVQSLSDVTSQITNAQLGIAATEGIQYGKFQMIIPANAKLPCSGTRNFNLTNDGQTRLDITYYEYDVKNYPHAVRVDEQGMNEIDTLIIDNLPEGLKKDEVVVEVTFTAEADGSLDISAEVKDTQGNSIQAGEMSIAKESDLE